MSKNIIFVLAFALVSEQVNNVLCQNTAENSSSSNVDNACYSSVQHLHFRIVIGALKWPENEPAPQNLTVPAWAKIILRVQKTGQTNGSSACDSVATFNILQINPRGCQIDAENLTVTHIETGKRLKIAKILSHSRDNISEPNTNARFSIQAAESLLFNDPLEIHVPFKLTLTQNYFENHWQGLYFYNTKHMNLSDQLYGYSPYHAPFLFPTLYTNEPEALSGQRATFKISVARPENHGYVAVSNMDVVETVKIEGIKDAWVRDHFRQSPPIPLDQATVMILSGFENHTVVDKGSKNKVTVWSISHHSSTPENVRNNSLHTGGTMLKLIHKFEKTVNGTRLPVGKLDVVAVPEITGYVQRPSNLGISASYVYDVVAQDGDFGVNAIQFLAQQVGFQWLGGMVSVTCYLETEDPSYCRQQINGLLQYMVKSIRSNDQEEDPVILFNVEALILDMIGDVFSRPVMESAVANFYLPKMKWKTASARDFYDALQQTIVNYNLTHRLPNAAVNEQQIVTIGEIIAPWHHHKFDYPRIYVSQVENDSRAILVSQRDLSEEHIIGELLWWVPLKISTEAGEDLVWLAPNVTINNSKNATYIWSKKDVIDTTKWLVINPDGDGYYSVHYSDHLWRNILDQLTLNHTVIGSAARNYLIHNQFTIPPVENKWEEMRKALEITQYLRNERSVLVWTTALDQINGLRYTFLKKPEANEPFQPYFGSLINSVLEDIGTSPQPEELKEVKRLRNKLMEFCGHLDVPVCTEYSVVLMNTWMKNPANNPFKALNTTDEAVRELYCAAIRHGQAKGDQNTNFSTSSFDFIVNQLVSDTDTLWSTCNSIGSALACTPNNQLLLDLLNNSKVVHATKDLEACFANIIANQIIDKKGCTMTQVVYEFWTRELLQGKISPATFMRFMWGLNFNFPPGLVDQIKQFLEKNDGLFKDDLVEHVANFKRNIDSLRPDEFWKDVGDKMVKWFRDNQKG